MRSFKRCLLLSLIILIIGAGLSFALEPPTFRHYLNIDISKMEKEGLEPDLIFMGNSRVMTAFDPVVFMEKMSDVDVAINAGTGSQGIAGSYYYIKDLVKKYPVKYVVLGIDYQELLYADRPVKRDLVVLERINSPLIKAEYVTTEFDLNEYPYFFKIAQYKDNYSQIGSNLKEKFSKEYFTGKATSGEMRYQQLGFVKETESLGVKGRINGLADFDRTQIDPSRVEYLDRIVDLCSDENIKLFLVISPLTQSTPFATKGYGEAWKYIDNYADEHGLFFDDLNLIRNRDLEFPDDMMNGMEHVGGELAEIVSAKYAEILMEHIGGTKDCPELYSSFDEMAEDMPAVVGWEMYTESLGPDVGRIMKTRLIAREGVVPEYSFVITNPAGEFVLQDFSDSSECVLPADKISFPLTLELKLRLEDGSILSTHLDIDENTWTD